MAMKRLERLGGDSDKLKVEIRGMKEEMANNMGKSVVETREVNSEIAFIHEGVKEIRKFLDSHEREWKKWNNEREDLNTHIDHLNKTSEEMIK